MPRIEYPPNIVVYDEGVLVGSTHVLDFVGPLIHATEVGGIVTVTVTPSGDIPSTTTFTAGEALVLGDLVALAVDGGSGTVRAYRAVNTSAALRRVQGVAAADTNAGNPVLVTTLGTASIRTAIAIGPGNLSQTLYLSTTPGCATPTLPVAPGDSIVEVGALLVVLVPLLGQTFFRTQFIATLG